MNKPRTLVSIFVAVVLCFVAIVSRLDRFAPGKWIWLPVEPVQISKGDTIRAIISDGTDSIGMDFEATENETITKVGGKQAEPLDPLAKLTARIEILERAPSPSEDTQPK